MILRTSSGLPIGGLRHAYNVVPEICYNDLSKITFNIPAFVDKKKTPQYDDIIGMRIVDLKDIGQFILMNPKTINNGIKEIKECVAYSLEYEFTFKKIFLENSTYNFWNPVARGGTILDIILEKMPSWSIGTVDTDLVGKYRTFDINNDNLYDFIKSKIQETYQCIFEFNTYSRVINVRSIKSSVITEPVYFSFDNLIKDIEISEDSESITTCLDVSGADGIDIRSVNPMGTNKIYNLSYFMNTKNFTQGLIDKYNSWIATFESYQLPYYNLTVENALKTTELLTEQAALSDLNGELKNLQNQQAVIIQAIGLKLKSQSDLNSINQQIISKNAEIYAKMSVISDIEDQLKDLTSQMVVINKATAFARVFTDDELLLLDRCIKEESLQDSSFVAPSVKNFSTSGLSSNIANSTCNINGSKITKATSNIGKDIYTISGGEFFITSGLQIAADIIKASYAVDTDNKFLFTAYFKSGSIDGSSLENGGCISLTGTTVLTTSDVVADTTMPLIFNGTQLDFNVLTAQLYFTQNTTVYEKRSVEWDLYDYGRECLRKLSYPSYSFSVSMADFLCLDEFKTFKNNLNLGNKVYLKVSDDGVIQPIVIKCIIDFDNPENFKFEFSNTYKSLDVELSIEDLLQQSISMGNKVDFNQYSYNAWIESGAESQVSQFIQSALDVSKNAIVSSSGQAPTFDDTGLRLRKLLDNGEYSPKQIWANNNSIMFTSDNWNTAEIAIGEFYDDNCGTCWGVIAPNIVGTLLAGKNLVIESEKRDGSIAVFKVDASGAVLHNAVFDLVSSSGGKISLDPLFGIIGGYASTMFNYNATTGEALGIRTSNGTTIERVNSISFSNLPNPNFWLDMYGDAFFKGKIYATSGEFNGVVKATDFLFQDGGSVKTLLNNATKQIPASMLDLTAVNKSISNASSDANSAYNLANSAYNLASRASNDANSAYNLANSAYNLAQNAPTTYEMDMAFKRIIALENKVF